ncbi:MAG: DMT family transporter [Planctomycetes bacterium]|nr:DMT family transporter [Planctomycetota bacterium]
MTIERAGELAGLATSALWVISSLSFAAAGRRMGATQVNLLRSLLAGVFLLGLHWILSGTPWPQIGSHRTWILALSGVLGLAIGDQFLFAGYVLVGPRTTTLLLTLAPAVAAMLSWVLFGEWMVMQAIVGMTVTLAGVMWVAAERPHASSSITPAQQRKGVWYGVGAAVCQGLGMVLASNGLKGAIDPISAQTVRMSAGAVGIVLIAMIVGRMNRAKRNAFAADAMTAPPPLALPPQGGILALLLGTVTGPILGVWCSLYALQKLEVGVATTLMSLVPVMILPFTRLTEGRWPTPRAMLGAVIAVAGVAILATAPSAAVV